MLATEHRATASDLLRSPAGYDLDNAFLTTYTLDLEVALALPFNALTQAEEDIEDVLADPLRLVEPLRQAAQRFHIFVDRSGIAVPRGQRELYSMIEPCLHLVKAPRGGILHAKVWVIRFVKKASTVLRIAVMSRNLTGDRSWDVAISSDAKPQERQRYKSGKALAAFFRTLRHNCDTPLPRDLEREVLQVADELERTRFPSPHGFDSPIDFHVLGIDARGKPWRPALQGSRTLAISPFVNSTGIKAIAPASWDRRILVSRQEELDNLSDESRSEWNEVYTLNDSALGESENESPSRHFGLHAKMVAVEKNHRVTWFLGSANLTTAALNGSNIEVIASITGMKGRPGGKSGHGIDKFLDAGFRELCCEYQPSDSSGNSNSNRLAVARDALLKADMKIACAPSGDLWQLQLLGTSSLNLESAEATAWPVSVAEDQAHALGSTPQWSLPVRRLTSLIAFRIRAPDEDIDDICLTLKLPAENMPENRLHHVLLSLIEDKERFFALLRALLGGLDELAEWSLSDTGGYQSTWGIGLDQNAILENLVRTATRSPDRLHTLNNLIAEIRATEQGKNIVPDDFFDLWKEVMRAANIKASK